uniref:CHAT domain-containing protein n=1 Tax=Amphimedon queenslandica TaxID=400682 RepID=A0A1X7U0U3_AMPQE
LYLSTCYTNGLSLNDLYLYSIENGDTMRTEKIVSFIHHYWLQSIAWSHLVQLDLYQQNM